MNTAAWIFVALAGVLAVADWVTVSPWVRSKPAEYALKPATLVALVLAAAILDPERDGQRAWFVIALVLSLAGDVFLMLPRDAFIAGLGSFLLAHLAYIVGFALEAHSAAALAIATAAVAIAAGTLGSRILGAVRRVDPEMMVPVAVYMSAISVMAVLAAGTSEPFAAAGAALFFSSDSLIAWDRFVAAFGWARPAIMSTYHLGQAALVVSLTR